MQQALSAHRSGNIRNRLTDSLFRSATALAALIVISTILFISIQIYRAAAPALSHFGWKFFTTSVWNPVEDQYGGLPFIWGTLLTSILALCIAIPFSLATAIYIAEIAPSWLKRPVSFVVELLAAIPSVVYGLWAIYLLIPLLQKYVQAPLSSRFGSIPIFAPPAIGPSVLSAVLVLSVMVIPYITAVARDVIVSCPQSQREASVGLGATRWETISHIVLRYCRQGILAAIMLGYGRAVGETMAVTMVIGNRPSISASILQPGYTMASVVANEFSEADAILHYSSLSTIGLCLLVVTLAINILARLLIWRITKQGNSKS